MSVSKPQILKLDVINMTDLIKSKDVKEVYTMQQEFDHLFLDVRTKEEFRQVHAKGTKLLCLDDLNEKTIEQLNIPYDKKLYIICRSGKRSMIACDIFSSLGYKDLTNVSGGTLAWLEHGLPVNQEE